MEYTEEVDNESSLGLHQQNQPFAYIVICWPVASHSSTSNNPESIFGNAPECQSEREHTEVNNQLQLIHTFQ